MNKYIKSAVSTLLFVIVLLTANIGLCGPIPFWYSHNGFVTKYNKVMDKMQCGVELDGQPLNPRMYKIKQINVENNVYYNLIAEGPDGPSVYIINDIKSVDYVPKVNTTTIVVDANTEQYPVVVMMMELIAVINTANDTSDRAFSVETRNGIQAVACKERKSFDFCQGFRNFHVQDVSTGDGKIKIRVNFYV
jgi:hypothetical protein